jgi:ribosome biogenesis SPOUT family RNA methylase Rps3
MEPTLSPWLLAEYRHIAIQIPVERVVFTSFLNERVEGLDRCTLDSKSVDAFVPPEEHAGVCLLDEDAELPMSPEDASWVKYVLVGGILGDQSVDTYTAQNPDRTIDLRKLGFKRRHLGTKQMTLDHAALVAKAILEDGRRLEEVEWVDGPWFGVGERLVVCWLHLALAEAKSTLSNAENKSKYRFDICRGRKLGTGLRQNC